MQGAHAATRARSYRSGIYLPCLADVDHAVVTDNLSLVWKLGRPVEGRFCCSFYVVCRTCSASTNARWGIGVGANFGLHVLVLMVGVGAAS